MRVEFQSWVVGSVCRRPRPSRLWVSRSYPRTVARRASRAYLAGQRARVTWSTSTGSTRPPRRSSQAAQPRQTPARAAASTWRITARHETTDSDAPTSRRQHRTAMTNATPAAPSSVSRTSIRPGRLRRGWWRTSTPSAGPAACRRSGPQARADDLLAVIELLGPMNHHGVDQQRFRSRATAWAGPPASAGRPVDRHTEMGARAPQLGSCRLRHHVVADSAAAQRPLAHTPRATGPCRPNAALAASVPATLERKSTGAQLVSPIVVVT